MKTSAAGLKALMEREGVRLVAYRDSVGIASIGVGHTGRTSPPKVAMGQRITEAQALAYLAADLAPVEAAVNGAVRKSVIPVTQAMFDAMVSLAFNIGALGFAGSTVAHRLALGGKISAADAFLMWRRPAVLLGRRRAERKQFLS